MDLAVHFDLRRCRGAGGRVAGSHLARPVIRSVGLHQGKRWPAMVDVYMEYLSLVFLAERRTHDPGSGIDNYCWDRTRDDRFQQTWLESLQTCWFHVATGDFDAGTLKHLFSIVLTDVDLTVAERVASDLGAVRHYHSSFEVDRNSALHRYLYFDCLTPRYSLLSRSEAAILVEAGHGGERDFAAESLLRKCGFRHLHYEEYSPFDSNDRRRSQA